jgi:hypothetical protein
MTERVVTHARMLLERCAECRNIVTLSINGEVIGRRGGMFDKEPDRHVSQSRGGKASKPSRYAIGATAGDGSRLVGFKTKMITNRRGVEGRRTTRRIPSIRPPCDFSKASTMMTSKHSRAKPTAVSRTLTISGKPRRG